MKPANTNALNKTQQLKGLIEITGDDFGTYLCYVGELATRLRQSGCPEELIDLSIDSVLTEKIEELMHEINLPVAA